MYEVKNLNSLYTNYSENEYHETLNKKMIMDIFKSSELQLDDIFEGTCFHTQFIEKFNLIIDKINYKTKISLGEIITCLEFEGAPLKNLLKLLDSENMKNLLTELSLKYGIENSELEFGLEEDIFE